MLNCMLLTLLCWIVVVDRIVFDCMVLTCMVLNFGGGGFDGV